MAFSNAGKLPAATIGQKHHWKAGLFGLRPRMNRRSIGQPSLGRAEERHPHAKHARLFLPLRKQRRRLRIFQRNASHHGEAVGIALGGFETVIIPVAGPGRRHDYGPINSRLIHQRHELLDRKRLWHLRLHAGNPFPVFRLGLPQMHLSIDNRALRWLRHHLLRRQHRANGHRRTDFPDVTTYESPSRSDNPSLRLHKFCLAAHFQCSTRWNSVGKVCTRTRRRSA